MAYSLIAVSLLAWAALPILPFLNWETELKASWAVGLLVFAEITWWLAMPLLGPEVIALAKRYWQWVKAKCQVLLMNDAPSKERD